MADNSGAGGAFFGLIDVGLKSYTASEQARKAAALRFADTTTPEQREALQTARQRAAFGRLPGAGLAQSRLAQAQAATLQNAALGAGGSSDFLAAGAAADRNRQTGEVQLGVQGEQFNERAQAGLQQQLAAQAAQRAKDLASYNNQKAALTGAALENANNAATSAAAYGAYAYNNKQNMNAAKAGTVTPATATVGTTMAAPGIRGVNLPGYMPTTESPTSYGLGLRSGYYGTTPKRYRMAY